MVIDLGRALGHFTFSLIGLKRILFTNIKAPPSDRRGGGSGIASAQESWASPRTQYHPKP